MIKYLLSFSLIKAIQLPN